MRSIFGGLRSRGSDHFRRIGGIARATRFLAPIVVILSGGCAIHPVQQDVTGVPTPVLVQYIRCETRFAIQDKAIELLARENPPNLPMLAALTKGRGMPWPHNLRAGMNTHERAIYDKYIQTGIAYDFTFDITEDNTGSGIADPVKLITNGTAGVGLSASGDFKRENLRHFVVSETAQDLLENVQLGYPLEDGRIGCGPDYRSSNYAYPISGTIGIAELISTFFDLNEIRSLTADKSNSTVFADTLTFTTTLMGSASPHVIVAPTGNRLGLASPASLTASGSRIDKHALIIGLSLDAPKANAARPVAAAAVVPGYVGKSALQRSNVHSLTEQSALDAVTQARLDAYLDRAVH
jgi:hypothetical protein